MQILVLGIHRSGTSLVTRLINMMGAYFAPEGMSVGHNKDNPKGFWERQDVIACNETIFRAHRAGWADVGDWPLPYPVHDMPDIWKEIKNIVLNMDAFRPWVMKDPRLCVTLPYWKPFLEVPLVVIVHRDPLEIAQSLFNRDGMPVERGLALWEFYAVALLNASADLPRIFIHHADCLKEPAETVAKLYEALIKQDVRGLRMPGAREISAFIDPGLYRARPDERQRQAVPLSSYQQELAAHLQGKKLPGHFLSVSEEARNWLRQPLRISKTQKMSQS